MSSFDLKTAVNLLPDIYDMEDITNKIIDVIKLYATMLSNDGKAFFSFINTKIFAVYN